MLIYLNLFINYDFFQRIVKFLRYFQCLPNHGCFMKATNKSITKLPENLSIFNKTNFEQLNNKETNLSETPKKSKKIENNYNNSDNLPPYDKLSVYNSDDYFLAGEASFIDTESISLTPNSKISTINFDYNTTPSHSREVSNDYSSYSYSNAYSPNKDESLKYRIEL